MFFTLIALILSCQVVPAIESSVIQIADIQKGEVVIEGKSGLPIGTVATGFVNAVVNDKDYTTISVSTENGVQFDYYNNRKYDHFAFIVSERNAVPESMLNLQLQKIKFVELFTSGGDPKEFIANEDFVSGPSFRLRMHIAISAKSEFEENSVPRVYQRVLAWQDLESGRKKIVGILGEPIGTVMSCRCRIANTGEKSVSISANLAPDISLPVECVIFKKRGLVVDWKYLEGLRSNFEFPSKCYERVDWVGVPSPSGLESQDNNAKRSFSLVNTLVVRLPNTMEIPGFDVFP